MYPDSICADIHVPIYCLNSCSGYHPAWCLSQLCSCSTTLYIFEGSKNCCYFRLCLAIFVVVDRINLFARIWESTAWRDESNINFQTEMLLYFMVALAYVLTDCLHSPRTWFFPKLDCKMEWTNRSRICRPKYRIQRQQSELDPYLRPWLYYSRGTFPVPCWIINDFLHYPNWK